jgi:hypothetical protein
VVFGGSDFQNTGDQSKIFDLAVGFMTFWGKLVLQEDLIVRGRFEDWANYIVLDAISNYALHFLCFQNSHPSDTPDSKTENEILEPFLSSSKGDTSLKWSKVYP